MSNNDLWNLRGKVPLNKQNTLVGVKNILDRFSNVWNKYFSNSKEEDTTQQNCNFSFSRKAVLEDISNRNEISDHRRFYLQSNNVLPKEELYFQNSFENFTSDVGNPDIKDDSYLENEMLNRNASLISTEVTERCVGENDFFEDYDSKIFESNVPFSGKELLNKTSPDKCYLSNKPNNSITACSSSSAFVPNRKVLNQVNDQNNESAKPNENTNICCEKSKIHNIDSTTTTNIKYVNSDRFDETFSDLPEVFMKNIIDIDDSVNRKLYDKDLDILKTICQPASQNNENSIVQTSLFSTTNSLRNIEWNNIVFQIFKSLRLGNVFKPKNEQNTYLESNITDTCQKTCFKQIVTPQNPVELLTLDLNSKNSNSRNETTECIKPELQIFMSVVENNALIPYSEEETNTSSYLNDQREKSVQIISLNNDHNKPDYQYLNHTENFNSELNQIYFHIDSLSEKYKDLNNFENSIAFCDELGQVTDPDTKFMKQKPQSLHLESTQNDSKEILNVSNDYSEALTEEKRCDMENLSGISFDETFTKEDAGPNTKFLKQNPQNLPLESNPKDSNDYSATLTEENACEMKTLLGISFDETFIKKDKDEELLKSRKKRVNSRGKKRKKNKARNLKRQSNMFTEIIPDSCSPTAIQNGEHSLHEYQTRSKKKRTFDDVSEFLCKDFEIGTNFEHTFLNPKRIRSGSEVKPLNDFKQSRMISNLDLQTQNQDLFERKCKSSQRKKQKKRSICATEISNSSKFLNYENEIVFQNLTSEAKINQQASFEHLSVKTKPCVVFLNALNIAIQPNDLTYPDRLCDNTKFSKSGKNKNCRKRKLFYSKKIMAYYQDNFKDNKSEANTVLSKTVDYREDYRSVKTHSPNKKKHFMKSKNEKYISKTLEKSVLKENLPKKSKVNNLKSSLKQIVRTLNSDASESLIPKIKSSIKCINPESSENEELDNISSTVKKKKRNKSTVAKRDKQIQELLRNVNKQLKSDFSKSFSFCSSEFYNDKKKLYQKYEAHSCCLPDYKYDNALSLNIREFLREKLRNDFPKIPSTTYNLELDKLLNGNIQLSPANAQIDKKLTDIVSLNRINSPSINSDSLKTLPESIRKSLATQIKKRRYTVQDGIIQIATEDDLQLKPKIHQMTKIKEKEASRSSRFQRNSENEIILKNSQRSKKNKNLSKLERINEGIVTTAEKRISKIKRKAKNFESKNLKENELYEDSKFQHFSESTRVSKILHSLKKIKDSVKTRSVDKGEVSRFQKKNSERMKFSGKRNTRENKDNIYEVSTFLTTSEKGRFSSIKSSSEKKIKNTRNSQNVENRKAVMPEKKISRMMEVQNDSNSSKRVKKKKFCSCI